ASPGYTLTFSNTGNFFIGVCDKALYRHVWDEPSIGSPKIPDLIYSIYQGMFAMVTPSIIIGSGQAEQDFTYAYTIQWFCPLSRFNRPSRRQNAHDDGPDTVQNVIVGAVLIWFGWFGFNGGSALTSGMRAIMAFLVTNVAASSAAITSVILEYRKTKQFSPVAFCSGAIIGLVAITPGSGFVGPLATCGSINSGFMGFFKYPWHVLIADSTQPVGKFCSATLINDRVILTSALCVLKVSIAEVLDHPTDSVLYPQDFIASPEELRVWITYDLTLTPKPPDDTAGLKIKDVNIHPRFLYSRSFYDKVDFDIAMLTLKQPLEFGVSTSAVPVCLPSKFLTDSELEGAEIFSTKWHVNLTNLLEKQTVDSISEEMAGPSPNFIYNRMRCRVNTGITWISDRFLCTIAPDFSDTQHADLGGALLAKSEDRFTQYGINSWKSYIPLLSQKQPVSLATNVAGFMSRIEDYSEKMDAKWCQNDWNKKPKASNQFVATLVNQKLTVSKPWTGINSSFRNIRKSCHCGLVNSKQHTRIQGGTEAEPYEYGWQVQLVSRYKDGSALCGGSLINDRIVLTVAHCVLVISNDRPPTRMEAENIEVRIMRHYGVSQRDDRSRTAKVRAVIPHPEFAVFPTLINDIAIIVLSKPLNYNNLKGAVSPICIPETGEVIEMDGREDALVIGWGRLNALEHGTISSTLQQLPVKVISYKDCLDLLHMFKFQYPSFLEAGDKLCAGNFKKVWEYKDPGKVIVYYNFRRITNYNAMKPGGPLFLPLVPNSNTMVHIGLASLVTITGQVGNKPIADLDTVVLYTKTQAFLEFVDYYSLIADATWCSR
ncbi:Ammonium transporter 1, partial [Orchesella cincta]